MPKRRIPVGARILFPERNKYAVNDPDRAIPAAETALMRIADDPRVAAPLTAWVTSVPQTYLPRIADSFELEELCTRIVFDDLRLSYSWLAEWLRMLYLQIAVTREAVAFRICEHRQPIEFLPGEPLIVSLRRASKQGRREKSRRPMHGGAGVVQDVDYWYWHRVAHPSIPIQYLARELRAIEPRSTDGRNTVRNAIHRADTILQQIGTGGPAYIGLMLLPGAK